MYLHRFFLLYFHVVATYAQQPIVWRPVGSPSTTARIKAMVASDKVLYVATNEGIFSSSDEGRIWQILNNGLDGRNVDDLVIAFNTPIAAVQYNLWRLNLSTKVWENIFNSRAGNTPPVEVYVASLNNYLFSSQFSNVYRSGDTGVTWQRASGASSVSYFPCLGFTSTGENIIYQSGEYMFISNEDGSSWQPFLNFYDYQRWREFGYGVNRSYAILDSFFLMAYQGRNVGDAGPEIIPANILRTRKNNTRWSQRSSWEQITNGLPEDMFSEINPASGPAALIPAVQKLIVVGKQIFAGTWNRGIFYTNDYGNLWKPANQGLTQNTTGRFASVVSFAKMGNALYAATNSTTGNIIYRTDVATSVTSPPMQSDSNIASITPNPTSEKALLHLHLAEAASVKISIINLIGTEIAVPVNNVLPSGSQEIPLSLDTMNSGVYGCRIKYGHKVKMLFFTVAK